jgi:hypothetical protein
MPSNAIDEARNVRTMRRAGAGNVLLARDVIPDDFLEIYPIRKLHDYGSLFTCAASFERSDWLHPAR